MSASESELESHDHEGPNRASRDPAQQEINRLQEALTRREHEISDQAAEYSRASAERDVREAEVPTSTRTRSLSERSCRESYEYNTLQQQRDDGAEDCRRLAKENARHQKLLTAPRYQDRPSEPPVSHIPSAPVPEENFQHAHHTVRDCPTRAQERDNRDRQI